MADKTETITAHVMALTTEKLGKFFDTDDLGDKKRLERWHKGLATLPDDPEYIDGLFDPFYGEKQMPEPSDVMAEHWRNKRHDPYASESQSERQKQLTWAKLKTSATTPYQKEVCKLLFQFMGVPSERQLMNGRTIRTVIKPKVKMSTQEYMAKLAALGKKYNVPTPWGGGH